MPVPFVSGIPTASSPSTHPSTLHDFSHPQPSKWLDTEAEAMFGEKERQRLLGVLGGRAEGR